MHYAWYETVPVCRTLFHCSACPSCLDFVSDSLTMCYARTLLAIVQDSIRLLCVTIANHGAPEYAIGSLTLELLQSEGSNWDATMIGLRALLSVVMTAPSRLAGGKKFDPAVS